MVDRKPITTSLMELAKALLAELDDIKSPDRYRDPMALGIVCKHLKPLLEKQPEKPVPKMEW